MLVIDVLSVMDVMVGVGWEREDLWGWDARFERVVVVGVAGKN